ncbi:MAG: VWA domain-containing protein, partial [bacterium]
MRTSRLLLALTALSIFCFGCTEDTGNKADPTPPVSSGTVSFKNVQAALQSPSQVQFTFRVTDAANHAVAVADGDLQSSFRIFEDGEEIDYTETSYFVSNAANLEMDLVLLLDFTNSMASWEQDSLTAIDLMVEWAHDLIDSLATGHRLAIMEYHDRNLEAGIIAPFSSNHSLLHESLDDFVASNFDHGSSRNWDALAAAIDLFEGDIEDGRRRLVVAITDGRETSSELTPADVRTAAGDWQASVFIIGTGETANETTLRNVCEQTGGEYYPAASIASFQSELEQIRKDLGGQYRLSYVTLRTSGTYKVRVEMDYGSYSGAFEQLLDLGSIFGDDRVGRIVLSEPERRAGIVTALFRAQHVPRNIDRFRFRLDADKPFTIHLPAAADGGLC